MTLKSLSPLLHVTAVSLARLVARNLAVLQAVPQLTDSDNTKTQRVLRFMSEGGLSELERVLKARGFNVVKDSILDQSRFCASRMYEYNDKMCRAFVISYPELSRTHVLVRYVTPWNRHL